MQEQFTDLLNPTNGHEPIDIEGVDPTKLLKQLRLMKLIRQAEYCLARNRENGLIGGPVHLGIGQEAVAVGMSSLLESRDKVFGAHRSHAHLLALGADLRKLFAEVLGRVTGHSRGMGGSMHLLDKSVGFYGSVPIVAGTVPIAVGAGLASKLAKDGSVAIAYLGDGAVEEGVVHEALNFSASRQLPVIFVVENNLFASHMDLRDRQPASLTSRFAQANMIPGIVVDGNDVVEVGKAAESAILRARDDGGPSFIEAITYRWLGHVDWRDDIDVGVNRSQKDLDLWKQRDPIERLCAAINLREPSFAYFDEKSMDSEINSIIEASWQTAIEDPYPDPQSMLNNVYAN